MTKELATIQPYVPPYWNKRVWNPAGRNAWEKKVLVALELGSAESLEKLLVQRERTARWREPYGKTRAFALDYTADIIAGKRWVRLALTPQKLFQQWRSEMNRDELSPDRGSHGDIHPDDVKPDGTLKSEQTNGQL